MSVRHRLWALLTIVLAFLSVSGVAATGAAQASASASLRFNASSTYDSRAQLCREIPTSVSNGAPAGLGRRMPAETFPAQPTPEALSGFAAETAAARGGVYTLRDEAGNVVRTGRTKDLAARETAHANDPVLGDYQFNVEHRTDVYAEQRGLEQMLYDRYPGAQAANGGFNKIRGISPTNPNLDFYMQSAWDFLERMGLG